MRVEENKSRKARRRRRSKKMEEKDGRKGEMLCCTARDPLPSSHGVRKERRRSHTDALNRLPATSHNRTYSQVSSPPPFRVGASARRLSLQTFTNQLCHFYFVYPTTVIYQLAHAEKEKKIPRLSPTCWRLQLLL